MRCPDDSAELHKAIYEGDIEVDQCPDCGGLWLDHTELQSVQDLREKDYSKELAAIPTYFEKAYEMALAKNEGVVACPACEKNTEKREYAYCSQIMIDVCPYCRGVWLHNDELSELEIFFEKCRAETAEVRKGFFSSLKSYFA